MILTLLRDSPLTAAAHLGTFGVVSIDGVRFCDTLEPVRASLDPLEDHPAIPVGRYRVTIRYSALNKMMVPTLWDVPGRSNIEIHSLNAVNQTLGCIGVGHGRSGNGIIHSREAFNALMPKLAPVLAAQQDVFIDVREPD